MYAVVAAAVVDVIIVIVLLLGGSSRCVCVVGRAIGRSKSFEIPECGCVCWCGQSEQKERKEKKRNNKREELECVGGVKGHKITRKRERYVRTGCGCVASSINIDIDR